MKINKCKKCDGRDFFIQETLIHKATLNANDEELTVYKMQTSGIERIFCKNCHSEYSEVQFKKINF